MVKISVCVPTYKRPHTLEQLIVSFMAQPYKSAELLIIDDAPTLSTKQMVNRYIQKDKRIKYFTNKVNLGYAKNLKKTFEKSNGKYIFLLGDDDLIIGENILERYVKIFEMHPKVAFIYSNLLQFNNDLDLTFAYKFFLKNKEYQRGQQALQEMWLRSTFIGGIGIRKVKAFVDLFPKNALLFPQVELVGKLLISYNAYGLADVAVGARVHADQLGFHMMNKKRVTEEKHAYSELYTIADQLKLHTSKNLGSKIEEIVKVFLEKADVSSVLAEGTSRSKKIFFQTIVATLKTDKRVKHTPLFWAQLIAFLIIPTQITIALKETYRKYLINKYWKEEKTYFKTKTQTLFHK